MKNIRRFSILLLLAGNIIPFSGSAQVSGLSISPEMSAYLKKQSLVMAKRATDWAKDKTADILMDGVQEFIKENHLDQNTAGKILSLMAQNRESFEQIYEGVSSTDVQAAALSTQLLMGKILAENVQESKMTALLNGLTKYPNIATEASQALGSFTGGDYYKASETIGKLIWKQTAIGKGIDKAINMEKAGWDFLIQNQYDAAYQKYKEQGSDGLVRMFSGPAAYVREKYFQNKSVSNELIEKKMSELFEAAQLEETAAQAEQVKLERMYAMFQKMDGQGGVIFDFRKHWEQYGTTKETDVFDKFLWLSRAIRRDLLSVGIDSWQLGKTLNGGNPAFSAEAMSLLLVYVQGGAQAYKDKFAEIARSRFPKNEKPMELQKITEQLAAPTSHVLEMPGYWGHLSYTISGAKLDPPTGKNEGAVGGRSYVGKLQGNSVTISGTAVSDNESGGEGALDYYQLEVSVVIGMKHTQLLSYIAPKSEKLNKSFSYIIPFDKTTSKVYISVRLLEHNKYNGDFGWYVTAYLTW